MREATRESSIVDTGDGENILGQKIIEVEPQHQVTQQLHGTLRCDAVVIESGSPFDRNLIFRNSNIPDQKLLNGPWASDGFPEAFCDSVIAVCILLKNDVAQ